jgi:hypothetical protein
MMFQKSFCNCHNLVCFLASFFLIKCAPFLLKIEEGLNIDDYKR